MKLINVLFSIEQTSDGEPWWVGQCVEICVASQAKTMREIVEEMQRIIDAHFAVCEETGADPYYAADVSTREVGPRFLAAPRTMRGSYLVTKVGQ